MQARSSTRPKLVLASASEMRRQLLQSVGLAPDMIAPAGIDETPLKNELPRDYVARVAHAKALAAHTRHPSSFVIAADTIAACGRRILGKAANASEARRILTLLSGRRHRALTGLCIIAPNGTKRCRVIATTVQFKRLDQGELDAYLASDDWQGKAGCYGLQSRGGGFVESLNGSYSNVIGLPLVETRTMLISLGYR